MERLTQELSVTPIMGSNFSWDALLKDTQTLTGQNLTKRIDESGLKLSVYAKYLLALDAFEGNVDNPIDALKSMDAPLRHVSFSFLIVGKSALIFKICEKTDLSVISKRVKGGRMAVVTGTLRQWKEANLGLSVFRTLGLESIFIGS